MYEETPSEKALRLLKDAEHLKEIWWQAEDHYRQKEWQELLKNLNAYPHSVRAATFDEALQ
jgi:hypothetical protein